MSTIVHTAGTGKAAIQLTSGLRWAILDESKSQRSQIRSHAATSGASRYVLHEIDKTKTIGLYSDPMSGKGKGKLYSLSMLFLSGFMRVGKMDASSINAVLMMQPDGGEEKRNIIFIEGGQITRDTVIDRERAIEQVQEHMDMTPGVTLYCQYAEIGRQHTLIRWKDLARLADKKANNSILQEVPMSPYLIPAVLGVVAVICGYFAYDSVVVEPAKRQKAALEAQKLDQTPQYLAAADAALRSTGWEREDLENFFDQTKTQPVFNHGWLLDEMKCDLKGCTNLWSRHAGLISDLFKDIAKDKLLITPQDGAAVNAPSDAVSTLEKTFSRSDKKHKPAAVSRADLKPGRDVILEVRPVLQQLTNAGIPITASEIRKWTVAPLDGVRPSEVLMEMPIEITTPLFRAVEVSRLLPPYILIQNVQLNIIEGKVFVKLKGGAYARQ